MTQPGLSLREAIDKLLIDLPMPIRTPRLLIRPWRSGDGRQLFESKRESWPELKRWLSWASCPIEALTERAEEALVRRRTAEHILRTEIRLPVFDHAGRLRGRNFHRFSIARVIADIADAKARGAQSIFLVDDNIVLDVRRFTALCGAIIRRRPELDRLHAPGDDVDDGRPRRDIGTADAACRVPLRVPRHRELQQDLGFLKAESKNTKRVGGKRSRVYCAKRGAERCYIKPAVHPRSLLNAG